VCLIKGLNKRTHSRTLCVTVCLIKGLNKKMRTREIVGVVGVRYCECVLLVREDYSFKPVCLIKGLNKKMRTREVVCIRGCV